MSISPFFFKTIQSGGVLSVQLWLAAGTNADTADLSLTFNTSLASYNSFTGASGWTPVVNSSTPGLLSVSMFDSGLGSNLIGSTTDGLLGTFAFTPASGAQSFTASLINNGTSVTDLGDVNGNPIAASMPSTLTVALLANAAVTAMQSSVTDVASGQTTTASFTVTLSQAMGAATSVAWSVAGTGSNPAVVGDFVGGVLPSGTVNFAAGETSKTVTVQIAGTSLVGFDHQFVVTLSNPSTGVTIPSGNASATETIVNVNRSVATIAATSAVKLEGNSGTTPFTFTVQLDQAPVTAQTVNWSVAGSGAHAAPASEFVGGVLPTGIVTFVAGQTTATITVNVAANSTIQPDLGFTVQLSAPSSQLALGATASASGTILNDDGITLSGQAYAWSNHALLSGVSVAAMGSGDPAGAQPNPLELRNARIDGSGNLVADLWGNAGSGAGNFDATFSLPTGVSGSFTQAAGLPSGWTAMSNPQSGSLTIGGYGLTNITGWSQLGAVSFVMPAGTAQTQIVLTAGDIGQTTAVPFVLSWGSATTAGTGAFSIAPLTADSYALSASRAITDIGRSITSVDALNTLKLAVGLNPNATIDGVQAAVSPYELIAADVNGDGRVNASDALNVLKMAVGLSGAPAAQWIFVPETQTFWNTATNTATIGKTSVPTAFALSATPQANTTMNLVGILRGDVNASWAAPTGSQTLGLSYFAALSQSTGAPLSTWGITALTVSQALAYYAANPTTMTAAVIADTAANVQGNIDALQATAGKITGIVLTNSSQPTITISSTQQTNDATVLANIVSLYQLVVQASSLTVAQALAAFTANPNMAAVSILDTAANVASNINALQAMVAKVNSVAFTDSGTPSLSLTYTQYTNDSTAIAKFAGSYGLVVSGAPVSAAAALQANARVTAFSVSDTAATIAAGLDALNADSKISAIAFTDSGTPSLSITYTQYTNDSTAIGKFGASYGLVVSAAPVSAAAALQANSHVTGFSVTDTAANVAAGLDALNADSKISASAFTDSGTPSLSITYTQYTNDSTAIGKFGASYSFVVSAAPISAAAALQPNARVTAFSVSDSSANVALAFDALNGSSKLSAVALTDSNALAISYTQFSTDTVLLGKLPGSYTVSVSAVSVANATAVQGNTHVTAFSVSDSAANVLTGLTALNADTKISAIAFTDSGTPSLSLTYAQYSGNTSALGKFAGSYGLVVSAAPVSAAAALQANARVTAFSVSDSSTAVASAFDALNGVSKLSAVALTDSNALAITYTQFSTDTVLLGKLPGSYNVVVLGAPVSAAAALQANSHVTTFSVSDATASVAAAFDALNTTSKLSSVALTESSALPVTYAQMIGNTTLLGKLQGTYKLAVSGVAVANATTLQANGSVASFSITDTSTNVLDNLVTLNGDTKIATIAFTDVGTPSLSLPFTRYTASTTALASFIGSYVLVVSDAPVSAAAALQANARVQSFSVSDTAANVVAALDALNGASRLTSVSVSDTAPLSITGSQFANDGAVLAKITGAYTLAITTPLPASGIAAAQANARIASFSVADTTANIGAAFDTINTATKLSTLTLTDKGVMPISFIQLGADTTALAKLPPGTTFAVSAVPFVNYTTTEANNAVVSLSVTGVPTSRAAAVQGDAKVSGFTVSDSSANIAAAFATLNGLTRLTGVTSTDALPLQLSYEFFTNDLSVLGKLPASYTAVISNVPVANATAVQAVSNVTTFAVSDSSANLTAGIDSLNGLSKLSAITPTDSNPITITYAQFVADKTALNKCPSNYTLTISGVTVANASALQGNTHVAHFSVVDSTANVASAIDTLNGLAKLSAVTLTDLVPLSVTYTQMTNDKAVLAALSSGYQLNVSAVPGANVAAVQANANVSTFSVTGVTAATAVAVQAATKTGTFTLSDTSDNIAAAFDVLNGLTKLSSVTLTDPKGIAITYSQYTNETALLGKLAAGYSLFVSGVPAANAGSVQNDRTVANFSVSDTAVNIATNFDALNGYPKIVAAISTTGSPTISYSQFTTDDKAANFTGHLNVTDAPAGAAPVLNASSLVSSFSVIDSAKNVGAAFDALNSYSNLKDISLTDGGYPTISIDYNSYMNDGQLSGK